MIQEEWQTQKRRNGNQQVRFSTDKAVSQTQHTQTGIVSIPTQNTYINLEVQEYSTTGVEGETHNEKIQEHNQAYKEGRNVHREQRNKQPR